MRGAALVALGIGVMYVPAELILSAFLIGCGVRKVWESAFETDDFDHRPVRARILSSGEIARREPSAVPRTHP